MVVPLLIHVCGFGCILRRVYTGLPRLINAVESTKLNSTVERYCLHSSTKLNEAVYFKMAANELVPGRCCCDVWLFGERMSTHFRKKEITGRKTTFYSFYSEEQVVTCLLIRVMCGESPPVDTGNVWWVTQSDSTTLNEILPSPTCSPVNTVDHFRWKELFTRFNLVDSTVLINLGDPCKRALSFSRTLHHWVSICGESTTLNESWPSPICSPVNPVDHFRWKERFTRFSLVDSTCWSTWGTRVNAP